MKEVDLAQIELGLVEPYPLLIKVVASVLRLEADVLLLAFGFGKRVREEWEHANVPPKETELKKFLFQDGVVVVAADFQSAKSIFESYAEEYDIEDAKVMVREIPW